MTQAKAEVEGQTIEIDMSAVEKRINDNIDAKMKKYMEEFKVYEGKKQEAGGKGVVEAFIPDDKKKILLEEFQKGEKLNPRTLSEQWTIAIPKQAAYELAGHMRNYVFVTDVIAGKPGDIVNIPYVKDLVFAHVVAGTGAFSATTGLVSVLTTTLHECGAYYDAYYADIEKIDANLLDELNRVFAHAAIRAEDFDLMNLCEAGTTSQFGETAYGSNAVRGVGDVAVAGSTFEIKWIADAIGQMLRKGKEVHPGELILAINPVPYAVLLKKLTATTATAWGYARPELIKGGVIDEVLGVKVVIMGDVMRGTFADGIGGGATSYQVNFLLRPKRALALAPKRDILIETDKLIATRQLRITGSNTFGVCKTDLTEVVPIWSGAT